MLPFNSQVPNLINHCEAYCAKVLPLVFDNSLSYYEFLCKMNNKLNELCDAVNAQNLNIIEFAHMVSLEIEKFEKFVNDEYANLDTQIKTELVAEKAELDKMFNNLSDVLHAEMSAELATNKKFREELTASMDSFKELINTSVTNFENEVKTDQQTFESNMVDLWEDYYTKTDTKFNSLTYDVKTGLASWELQATIDLDKKLENDFATYTTTLNNQFEQYKTDTDTKFNSLTYDVKTGLASWELQATIDLDKKLENDFATYTTTLNNQFEQYKTDTTATFTALIDTKYSQIQTYVTNSIADVNHAIALEINDRENADSQLQAEIDALSPENSLTYSKIGNSYTYADVGINVKNVKYSIWKKQTNGTYQRTMAGITYDTLKSYRFEAGQTYSVICEKPVDGNANGLAISATIYNVSTNNITAKLFITGSFDTFTESAMYAQTNYTMLSYTSQSATTNIGYTLEYVSTPIYFGWNFTNTNGDILTLTPYEIGEKSKYNSGYFSNIVNAVGVPIIPKIATDSTLGYNADNQLSAKSYKMVGEYRHAFSKYSPAIFTFLDATINLENYDTSTIYYNVNILWHDYNVSGTIRPEVLTLTPQFICNDYALTSDFSFQGAFISKTITYPNDTFSATVVVRVYAMPK